MKKRNRMTATAFGACVLRELMGQSLLGDNTGVVLPSELSARERADIAELVEKQRIRLKAEFGRGVVAYIAGKR